MTELNNKARREFRQAKRQGSAREEIQSLARNFFDLHGSAAECSEEEV